MLQNIKISKAHLLLAAVAICFLTTLVPTSEALETEQIPGGDHNVNVGGGDSSTSLESGSPETARPLDKLMLKRGAGNFKVVIYSCTRRTMRCRHGGRGPKLSATIRRLQCMCLCPEKYATPGCLFRKPAVKKGAKMGMGKASSENPRTRYYYYTW